jgi:hypothetical protein
VISRHHIAAWRSRTPWPTDAEAEADLAISRVLVEIFSVPELAGALVLQGRAALEKLYQRPATTPPDRIELVQRRVEPIGPTLDRLRAALDPWLGPPRRKLKASRVLLIYRFRAEDDPHSPLRLTIEIHTREQDAASGTTAVAFSVDSDWFRGRADVTTFPLARLVDSSQAGNP